MKHTTVGLVVVFAALVGGMLWIAAVPSTLDLDDLEGVGVFALPDTRPLAPFELVSHTGQPFVRDDLVGNWSFLFFGYASCPDVCPITMSILGQADRILAEEGAAGFQGILVSVDPARDTPAALGQYVASFSPRFAGVTGSEEAVEAFALQMAIGFRRQDVDSAVDYLVEHSPYIVIVDPQGAYYGYIKPPFDAARIALTYRTLAASDRG